MPDFFTGFSSSPFASSVDDDSLDIDARADEDTDEDSATGLDLDEDTTSHDLDSPSGADPAPAGRRARKPSPSSVTPAQVRRVLQRWVSVADLDDHQMNVCAALLGCDQDVESITIASFAGKPRHTVVADLDAVRGAATDFDAFATGIELHEKGRLQAVYDAVRTLSDSPTTKLPTAEVKAARTAVPAIRDLSDPDRLTLSDILDALTA